MDSGEKGMNPVPMNIGLAGGSKPRSPVLKSSRLPNELQETVNMGWYCKFKKIEDNQLVIFGMKNISRGCVVRH